MFFSFAPLSIGEHVLREDGEKWISLTFPILETFFRKCILQQSPFIPAKSVPSSSKEDKKLLFCKSLTFSCLCIIEYFATFFTPLALSTLIQQGLQNFFASVSNLMGTFARRCLLSYQPRNVLSKQNKSNRSLPILLQRLESHGNIVLIFKKIKEMSDRNTSDVVRETCVYYLRNATIFTS